VQQGIALATGETGDKLEWKLALRQIEITKAQKRMKPLDLIGDGRLCLGLLGLGACRARSTTSASVRTTPAHLPTCRFPEFSMVYADRGCQILLFPGGWLAV